MNRRSWAPAPRRTGPFTALAAVLLATLVAGTGPADAQTTARWNRYPALSPDGRTLVFTYRGDLWRVPASGGTATPLTSHPAHDYMPVWSPDGGHIAFASDRHGNFDVYLIPAAGGPATRLTVHSADEEPYTFSAEGDTVLFGAARLDAATNRGFPTGSQPELYAVPVTGGRVTQLLTTPAEAVHVAGDGSLLLYHDRKGGENEWRKHHTSAIARDLWAWDRQAGIHRQLTTFAGEDRDPHLAPDGETVYYLSEESGSFNVHRMPLGGGPSEQVTDFTGEPVRFLSVADDGTLAFSWAGELYTKRGEAEPHRVPVTVRSDAAANREEVIRVTGGAGGMALSPDGDEVAFIHRGEVFVTAVEGGMTKQITRTPGTERDVSFSPDGDALVYSAERDGSWGIYRAERAREEEPFFYAATLIEESPLVVNALPNAQPVFSPDGEELAFVEDRNTLKVMELDSGETRTLLTLDHISSSRIGGQYFRWSPDGRWILFDQSIPGFAPGEVGLVRADGSGEVVNLTKSGFRDYRAQWVLDGEAMIWFSNRDGLKSAAQSGRTEADVYAMYFTQDAWDRHRLDEDEYRLLKALEEEEDGRDEAGDRDEDDDVEPVALELDDAELRTDRLTIHSARLGGALLSEDGETLYYLARFEQGYDLWSTDVRTREAKRVAALDAGSGEMIWDGEQEDIFLLADGRISKIDPSSGKRETVTIQGEMTVDRDAEREQLFEHVWHRTDETFYTAGFHGADWDGLKETYQRYLPHMGNEYEFAEMLSEMLGELNVSHSGARYGSSDPTDDETASLGIFHDQRWDGPGIRVVEVMDNGPLDRDGMNVKPGMIIESIDGEAVGADRDPAEFLNRKAGRRTLVVLRDGDERRELVVTPITPGQERRLLYDRWVRRNRAEVDRLSDGRLGYIHIPGMNDGAYRNTVEEALGRFATREGLVVDIRFNGGGDLVADLAMFLSGERFFDYTSDERSNGYEPNFRWTRPSISIANEAAYSDGHCYAYAYQALDIGPLVGMPVPGTCTFAGWEGLSNGVRWGVPGMGVKNTDGEYLENMQTEPDIRVMNEFTVRAGGRDQQLEAAVEALLERVR